tara:strand:- start:1819 stop:2043 length:225 start_codon:yes stop_codon:yes gene_type:complete
MAISRAQGPKGLYANINAKKKRIKAGSGEKMRKVGSKGAPTAKAFVQSKKTAKKMNDGGMINGNNSNMGLFGRK